MIHHENNTYYVIDVHTHFVGDYQRFDPLLQPIFDRVKPYQQEHFDIKEVGRAAWTLVEYLDKSGVDSVCLMAEEGPPTFYSVPTELCLGYASADSKRFFVIGNVNPRLKRSVAQRTKHLIDGGAKAFKIYASDHAQDPYDKTLTPLFEICAEFNLPVFFHTGANSRYPMAQNQYGDPLYWESLMIRYPEIPFVMCHGGKGGFEDNCLRLQA